MYIRTYLPTYMLRITSQDPSKDAAGTCAVDAGPEGIA